MIIAILFLAYGRWKFIQYQMYKKCIMDQKNSVPIDFDKCLEIYL